MMNLAAKGFEALKAALKGAEKEFAVKVEERTKGLAQAILAESQKLVPVDTERLKKSGKVEKQGIWPFTVYVVSYDTPYAVYVHEDLTKYHAPPTQAKFLEQAARIVGSSGHIVTKRKGQ